MVADGQYAGQQKSSAGAHKAPARQARCHDHRLHPAVVRPLPGVGLERPRRMKTDFAGSRYSMKGGGDLRGQYGFAGARSEEHTSELQSLMRISYAVFCLKKKKQTTQEHQIQFHNKIQILT